MMKKTLLLLPALALGAVSASGQIIYTQPFDSTNNNVSLVAGGSALTNWRAALNTGETQSTDGNRQYAYFSDQPGNSGDPGFAYGFLNGNSGGVDRRAWATWFAGDLETPANAMNLAQSDLVSLSLRIGHGNTTNQTRWLMRIDDNGTDRWFVSLQTYQMTTAVAGAGAFATDNVGISANFSDLEWRPFLNGANEFDGLNLAASSGFTTITDAANPAASTLPSGNITAFGIYNWHSAGGTATRFDDFTITAIPEPSTYAALIGLLALGLVVWSRRRV